LTGAPALTSRQLKEADFVKVVELLDRGVSIAAEAKKKSGRYSLLWNCVDHRELHYLNLLDTSVEQY
jgi:glycine hydroxymethyltransferase